MNRWIEQIYERSPVAMQHAMMSLYGWKLKCLRYGGDFQRYLDELMQSGRYSATELGALQDEQFRGMIQHCYENVPFYAHWMKERKLTPADFKSVADLEKLPILTKELVRQQPERFYARNIAESDCEVVGTSGSTGTTLRIRVDKEGRRKNYAFFTRFKLWIGADLNARTATFAGRPIVPPEAKEPPFWRYNLANRNLLFSSYHLSDRNLPHYLRKLREWGPKLMDSYPSSVEVLARYMEGHGEAGPHPSQIVTSSETLLPEARAVIERAFQTRIYDQYGGAEQVVFAAQCEAGSYHVNSDYGYVELLSDATTSEGLRVVATGFTNRAMPLLRYETGDLAVGSTRSCACGRNFSVWEKIIGRLDDMLLTSDGRRVGRLDPIFKGLTSIRRAQIVQTSLSRIEVKLVPGEGFSSADTDSIRHELEQRVGPNMQYEFSVLDEIPVGPGGKFRAVVCRVGHDGNIG